MHDVMNRILPKLIFSDRRLRRTSRLVYLGMRAHPKSNRLGYAKSLDMPYQTVRDAIAQLKELHWAYSFTDPATGHTIIVPWMPLDVEAMLAEELKILLDTAPNRGESLLKAFLDIFVDDPHFFDNHRYRWVVTSDGIRLEIDRYYVDARVAIEFQGRQHFETVSFRDGKSDLQAQLARDRTKYLACKRQKVAFVEIADIELSWETVCTKLGGLLPLLHPPKDRPLFRTLEELAVSHAKWARSKRDNP